MKKAQAHRRLALAASKKGYRVQIHKTAKEDNLRLVAPDGSVLTTTLTVNASREYDTPSVMEAIGDIEKLNSSIKLGKAPSAYANALKREIEQRVTGSDPDWYPQCYVNKRKDGYVLKVDLTDFEDEVDNVIQVAEDVAKELGIDVTCKVKEYESYDRFHRANYTVTAVMIYLPAYVPVDSSN